MIRRIESHKSVLVFTFLLCVQNSNSSRFASSSVLACQSAEANQLDRPSIPTVRAHKAQVDTPRRSNALNLRRKNLAKDTANRLRSEAETLAGDWRAESLRKAIEKNEQAQTLYRSIRDRSAEAIAIKRIGDIHYIFGRNSRALSYYFRALVIARAVDRVGAISILNAIARAFGDLGDAQRALKYAQQAKQYSDEGGDHKAQAEAMTNIGLAFYSSSDTEKALGALVGALELWKAVGNLRGQADTLINMGYSYGDSGDLNKALECYNQALMLAGMSGDRRTEAQALTAIGGVHSSIGQKQQALHHHSQASQLFHTIGDCNGEAVAFNGLGYVYEDLGEKREALRAYTRAMNLFKAVDNRFYEGLAMGYIGNVLQTLGENRKALSFYLRRLALSRAFRNRHVEAYTLEHIGSIFAALGNRRKALVYYNRALTISRNVLDKRGQSITLSAIGSNYEALGKRERALQYYEEALLLSREAEDRSAEMGTLYNIARIKRDMGKLDEARSIIEESVKIVDSIRQSVASRDLRASYFASVHQGCELYVDILMRMHKAHPSQGFDVLAFEASDRARARSLLETIAEAHVDLHAGVPVELLQQERSLQQSLRIKIESKMRLANGKNRREEAGELAKEITSLTSALVDVQGRIKESSPNYAALTQPAPLTLREIQQQTLDADTVLLEYMLGEERSYLWTVSTSGISSHEIARRGEIETLAAIVAGSSAGREPRLGEPVAHYLARIAHADRTFSKAAQQLSLILFAPVASEIATKRLLVVSEGMLQYVPLNALPSQRPVNQPIRDQAKQGHMEASSQTTSQPMIFDHEIVTIASASTLAILRRQGVGRAPAPKLVAILADPVFDKGDPRVKSAQVDPLAKVESQSLKSLQKELQAGGDIPRLPSTRREAEAILNIARPERCMMAVDFDACRATAMSDELGQYRIIHFATHAILNTEEPALSGILLSLVDKRGQSQDGFVGLNDIYNMKVSADLVILSACTTALGKDIKGEGLGGLGRSFMYAGAPRVVASLWKVDDLATANLMRRFYNAMLTDGIAPAAALRTAQIEMCSQVQWKSPYYWAAFVLQGEYN